VKFDGSNWTVYDESNSGLPHNRVYALAIDGSDNIWIGTYGGGLAKFDGANVWTAYNTTNSGLPHNTILSLAIDGSNNIWVGTWGGLAKFDGSNWTVYNTSNSGLPDEWVFALAIDGNDNTWIGTWLGGLAVYQEGGVVNIDQESRNKQIPSAFSLSQNYPNPFNPLTTIEFFIPKSATVLLEIFDIRGKKVLTLVDSYKIAGVHEVNFDASHLSSGIYLYRIKSGDFVDAKKMILMK
jgi:hypothetical protein